MAEVKRPKLISIGCERVNDKNTKEISKTVRISVVLSDSTEDSFPEFNYQDELVAVTKKCSKNSPAQTNGLDPFNEDDEDVKRIAAQMNAKYGVSIPKKKKCRKDDFADIGMGYDESDSFIDNTDGYDEIIPKNVTTVHGGFYINSGALEFKTDEMASSDELSSSDGETSEKSPNRKRILESSAASEDETPNSEKSELPEKKQKLILTQNGMQKAIKKRLFGHDKIKQIRKKRNSESKRTVRDLLKERRVELDLTISQYDDTPEKNGVVILSNENKKSPDSVDNVIESVINAVVKKKDEKFENLIKETSCENAVKDIIDLSVNHSSDADSNDGIEVKSPLEYVQLPENLPSDIIEIIDTIKNAAASSTEGKVKFFTGNINVLLLNLERKCRCLGRRTRIKIYEHLAPFVKCRKETLIKRAKNLVIIEDKKRIKILMDKLKGVIGTTMPSILTNYEEESKLVLQKKFSPDEDANRHVRMPKRHFPWDEGTKKLLRDIITLRKKCLLNEGKPKDSIELNLITFIKSELQIMWPEGWMSMNTLMKYSNLTKDKKALASSMKSSSNNTPLDVRDRTPISTAHISISPSCGLTITPVSTSQSKNNFLEGNPTPSIPPGETIITRISNDNSNTSKSSIVLPLTPPDISKTPQTEHTNIKYNNSSVIINTEETPILKEVQDLLPKERLKTKDDVDNEATVKTEIKDESETKHEEIAAKVDVAHTSVIKQDKSVITSSPVNIIDLTDQPELIRKPGPRSKTKYYAENSDGTKVKKESSRLNEEFSGSSALNKIIADSLSSDLNKVAHKSTYHTGSTSNHSNSIYKNHSYDYSKTKTLLEDYSKMKFPTSDSLKTKSSANDLSRIKLHAKDISLLKPQANDFSKIKSAHDVNKIKSSTNDFSHFNDISRIKSSNDYSGTKSVTEGDDIKMVMESLMNLQKMASPVKSKDEARSSSAVSVINFNKGYSHDSKHSSSSSHSSTANNVPYRNSTFQDAFQKQFIPDFNLMKASQTFPPNRNGNSVPNPKFIHTSHKSNSALSDRFLQNSNHIYPQQNSNNKLKSVNCSPPQSVGSYSMLDDMYTNFLNEYGQSIAANSKSSTHPK